MRINSCGAFGGKVKFAFAPAQKKDILKNEFVQKRKNGAKKIARIKLRRKKEYRNSKNNIDKQNNHVIMEAEFQNKYSQREECMKNTKNFMCALLVCALTGEGKVHIVDKLLNKLGSRAR